MDIPDWFKYQSITDDVASVIDSRLHSADIISLIFLLVDDSIQALLLCVICSKDEDPFPNSGIIQTIAFSGRSKKIDDWEIKVICALYIINRLRTLRLILGISYEMSCQLFKDMEHKFLSAFKVALFKICENLKLKDIGSFFNNVSPDCLSKMCPHKRMEINLLELITQGYLQEQSENTRVKLAEILTKLNKHKLAASLKCIKMSSLYKNYLTSSIHPSSTCYRMNNGFCLIINQRNFYKEESSSSVGYEQRIGTDFDRNILKATFERFSCKVKVCENLTDRDLLNEFERTQEMDFSNYDFLIVCLLSHGYQENNQDLIMGVNGAGIRIKDVIAMFTDPNKCEGLLLKPKIFIIQACRGTQFQSVSVQTDSTEFKPKIVASSISNASLQVQSVGDYFVAQSTIGGLTSMRHTLEGSFFIKILCQNINRLSKFEDLVSIFTITQGRVKEETMNQQPTFESTLNKKIFLVENKSKN